MDSVEYDNLDRVEKDHWYYSGKRSLVDYWIRKLSGETPGRVLVDCGAGTGRFALEQSDRFQVMAVDDHEESLRIAKQRLGAERVFHGSATAMPFFEDNTCDVLTALDVIEHIPDDLAAVREMKRVLKPGGLLVVTVPALMGLWSDWDEALHHQRRYHARQLLDLARGAGLEIVHWHYTNVAVLPLVWAVRKWQQRVGRTSRQRAEDAVPPRLLNTLLKKLFELTGRVSCMSFPAGVSLLLCCRKAI